MAERTSTTSTTSTSVTSERMSSTLERLEQRMIAMATCCPAILPLLDGVVRYVQQADLDELSEDQMAGFIQFCGRHPRLGVLLAHIVAGLRGSNATLEGICEPR